MENFQSLNSVITKVVPFLLAYQCENNLKKSSEDSLLSTTNEIGIFYKESLQVIETDQSDELRLHFSSTSFFQGIEELDQTILSYELNDDDQFALIVFAANISYISGHLHDSTDDRITKIIFSKLSNVFGCDQDQLEKTIKEYGNYKD